MDSSENFTLIQKTKGKLPRLPFVHIKEKSLGITYELALIFVGDKTSRALNKKYRDKTYTPNVLSFPLSKNAGEIYINPNVAKKQAPKFGVNTETFIAHLFIHGLMHLKGYDHGSKMDKAEAKIRKEFSL
jgi:probable rRNA maturation factor